MKDSKKQHMNRLEAYRDIKTDIKMVHGIRVDNMEKLIAEEKHQSALRINKEKLKLIRLKGLIEKQTDMNFKMHEGTYGYPYLYCLHRTKSYKINLDDHSINYVLYGYVSKGITGGGAGYVFSDRDYSSEELLIEALRNTNL